MYKVYKMNFANRELVIEFGKYAKQATKSALIRYDGTEILATITMSKDAKNDVDFFPLSIDYQERLYAVGKIPGSFLKREGKPTDKAILIGRAIDRPLRPFFPKKLRNEVVISLLVLSVNKDANPDVVGMLGAIIVSMVSKVPFNGPIAGVDVGFIDGKYILNPTEAQREKSDLYLTLAGSKEKIVMIEAGASELTNEQMLNAIKFGHEEIKKVCDFFEMIQKEIGDEKIEIVDQRKDFEKDFEEYVENNYLGKMRTIVLEHGKYKEELQENVEKLKEESTLKFIQENETKYPLTEEDKEYLEKVAIQYITQVEKKVVRNLIIDEHRRADGREIDQVRDLHAEVSILSRTHGSGLFSRGETQVLSIATLGKITDSQKLDGLDSEETKRYMHHYNFPGFSVGEAKPSRGAGRREIGHGALAEKAIMPVLPSTDEFPYSIRVVSEVLESNGSTSQASVCGSTLSLMDAGVPIKKPVAGISTGLVTRGDEYIMLTDIQGLEDFFGDMDFKVAGTKDGITAIQVDIKCDGLTYEQVALAFEKTLKARTMIIDDVLLKAIDKPREKVSEYAPKIYKMNISVDKIRDLIGTGGKNITKIIDTTHVEIDIEDDGRVLIYANEDSNIDQAIKMVEELTKEFKEGEIITGKVTKIAKFGAFVDLNGAEGLLHISKITNEKVKNVEDVLSVGDEITVIIESIDENGKIALNRKILFQ